MAIVVEQTIPFSTESLNVENPRRWNTLLPLIRPTIQTVHSSSGQTILVDTALSKADHVRIAAIGRVGNFSSKLLEDRYVAAIAAETGPKHSIRAKDVAIALEKSGVTVEPGLVVVRSGKQRRVQVDDIVVEVEVNGDLELDHLVHALSTATEETRSNIRQTEELLKAFLKTATTAHSTFHTEEVAGSPAILHAEGSASGYERAKHAIERDLQHVMRSHTGQGKDVTYSVHYSDVNGLSRLENYILGLEIAKYFEAQHLPYALSSSMLLQHDKLARGFAISIAPVPDSLLAPQPKVTNPLEGERVEGAGLTRVDSRLMRFSDAQVRARLEAGCKAVIAEEPTITRYDEIVGDGDCGYTLRDGAKQVMSFVADKDLGDLPQTLGELVHDLEVNMGGTSGALYCIFLTALSASIASSASIPDALHEALEQMLKYTRARVGDRTMMDTLIPFVETLKSTNDAKAALTEAANGMETTKDLIANLGRSTYLEESATKGVPDPGAYGLLVLLRGMCEE